MKTYTIKQLKTLATQQGYKLAALENSKSERVQPFNKINIALNKQLDTITNRLTSDLFEDGLYYVLLSQSISKSKNADRYPIVKGKLSPDDLKDATTPVNIIHTTPAQEVLTYEAALAYQQTISDLKNEINLLKLERTSLQEQLQEALDENELSEPTAPSENMMQTFLKETMPSVMPVLDRYFDLEEKKLNLLELKAGKKPMQRSNNVQRPQPEKRIQIVTGSQQHLELIEIYYKKNQDDKLGLELDKLEAHDFELYKNVCEKLGIDISDDDNNQGGNNE
jgi:hypothetical protein